MPQDPAEEQIRRLLADARHDDPMPEDVVARIEDTLARLQAEREAAGDAGTPTDPDTAAHTDPATAPAARRDTDPVTGRDADPDTGWSSGQDDRNGSEVDPDGRNGIDELALRRRRRTRTWLAAAAAVVAVGVGGTAVIDQLGPVDSGSDGAGSVESVPDEQGPAAENRAERGKDPADSGGTSDLDAAYASYGAPTVAADTLAADAARVAELRTKPGTGGGAEFGATFPCAPADWGTGTLQPVSYQGAPAVLVLRPPQDGTRSIQLLACGTAEVLQETTFPAP
ncbi:hypothetical protein [Nocardioides insulae]|uniref:hypothetical protein n=1 Tax=Nocardioides insulae TaxID=394734 RepID=UPI0003F8A194|nr:hypothetical protein [Nocardioides insulae]